MPSDNVKLIFLALCLKIAVSEICEAKFHAAALDFSYDKLLLYVL